jgi:hypothetical protein
VHDLYDDLNGNCEAIARTLTREFGVEVKVGVIYRDRDARADVPPSRPRLNSCGA